MSLTKVRPSSQIVVPDDITKFLSGDGTWRPTPDQTVTPDSDETLTFTDVITNNADTSHHGFAPKAVAPAANLVNVLAIINGGSVWAVNALFDATNPVALGTTGPGTSLFAAHRDHIHPLPAIDATGAQTDITTRNASTSSHGLALRATAPAATFVNVLGLANGETAYKMITLWDATVPVADGTATAGTALFSARRDHVHPSITGAAAIGYTTGIGTAQTQGISKQTTVAANKACGTITLFNTSLAADTTTSFTFTNTLIAATDNLIITHNSVGTMGAYGFAVTPAAGSATIYVRNLTPGALAEAIVIRFTLIKGVVA